MKTFDKIIQNLRDIASVIVAEFKTIGTSYAILLVLMGGIFVYGFLYNFMYAPNVVRDAPIAVVDDSHSTLSREYTRLIDAASDVKVLTNNVDFPAAKDLMKKNEVIGIIYLPSDFDTRVSRGEESVFIMYGTTAAFLYYSAIQQASSGAMLELNDRFRPEMLIFLPQQDVQQITMVVPADVTGTALYNYTGGYGTYLIPAVLIVIIFQTLMMVIGMISGDERDAGTIRRFAEKGLGFGNMARIVTGKTFVYVMLYAVFSLFMLGVLPLIYQLPDIGSTLNIIALLIPFLIATSFFGLAASVFFTDSEAPLLMIAFFSVGLIFLSGVSYPMELMPWYWRMSHFIFPAAPATLAFVKLNSMGASMEEIHVEYITLWIQCVVYFVLACYAYRYNIRKSLKSVSTLKRK